MHDLTSVLEDGDAQRIIHVDSEDKELSSPVPKRARRCGSTENDVPVDTESKGNPICPSSFHLVLLLGNMRGFRMLLIQIGIGLQSSLFQVALLSYNNLQGD